MDGNRRCSCRRDQLQLSFNFVAALQLWAHFAEERPQDLLSHLCRDESQARGLRGLPELFAKGGSLYQTRQVMCQQAAGSSDRRSLGEKAPNLIIGGKAPKMRLGEKAPRL